jgi:glycine betaine/proline transport system ATP-binding protein
VRTIMTPISGDLPSDANGEVDINDTLESIIARSGGDTPHSYIVMKDCAPVGLLEMTKLIKALVLRTASNSCRR